MFLSLKTLSALRRSLPLLFLLCLGGAAPVLADPVNLEILGLTTSNPSPGTTMGVTVRFCDNTNFSTDRVKVIAAIRQGVQTGFASCPTVNQHYVVATQIAGGIASGPGMYLSGSGNDSITGGSSPPYYPSYNTGATPSCPAMSVTAVYDLYIEPTLNPGTHTFVVGAQMDYLNCINASAVTYVQFTVPLPPPGFTIEQRAEPSTPAPGSLILISVDYSFVNTTNFQLSQDIPANTTLVASSPGGVPLGGTVTWSLGDASSYETGTAWILVRLDTSVADGTPLPIPQASAQSNEVLADVSTPPLGLTARVPILTLTKSQSSASVAAFSNITYSMRWTADGGNLNVFDTYNNNSVGTAGNAIDGFDGTGYTFIQSGGETGNWTVASDAQGNHFIVSNVNYAASGGNYPLLLRDGPALDICAPYVVMGDMQIPVTAAGVGASTADAHMVLAYSTDSGVTQTYMVAISIDDGPNRLFLQKNDGGVVTTNGTNAIPSVQSGQWYSASVSMNPTGGTLEFYVKLWVRGTPEPGSFTYQWTDPLPFACGGGWRQGWQADATSGANWYSNLKVFSPGPVVDPVITDTAPGDLTYGGANVAPDSMGPPMTWNFTGSYYGQTVPLVWWGNAGCPGPLQNEFSMSADGIAPVTSNMVSADVTGSCITPTPTLTPTITPTPTVTPTGTITPMPTLTATPTPSPTGTPTPTPSATATPTIPGTATPTPVGLYVWPNPYNPAYAYGGTLKAEQVPAGATMGIYTISGELVIELNEGNTGTPGRIEWFGLNKQGVPVSTGTYYYLIQEGNTSLLTGKLLVIMGPVNP